uniref:Phospholipase-like protein n=1 Tax=Ascaris lumbricoides TaxID=6252 RepID=A0A0M3IU37_ASCLU
MKKMLPDDAFVLREECWNAYPYCKTILTVLEDEDLKSAKIRPSEILHGIYALKLYRIKSKSSWIVMKKILPDDAFVLREECWNAYPYCKTILTVLNLNKNMLKKREVTLLNIYDEKYRKNSDITPETDPRIFHSKLTGRGPFNEDWMKTTEPVMCCHKVLETA